MAWALAIIGLGLALMCVSSAVNYALRDFSRARMAELAERRGDARRLELLEDHFDGLTLTASAVRMTVSVVLALLVVHLFRDRPEPAWFFYGAVLLLTSVLVMVFGVAIPHAWAKYAGEPLVYALLPALNMVRLAMHPLVAFLQLFDGLVRRLAGAPIGSRQNGAEEIEQEILSVVSEGEAQGAVDEEEKEMIQSVMALDEMQVGQVMTPRIDIVALPSTATLFEAKELIAREGHSRIPIYEESLDNLLGVLYAKDLLSFDRTDDFDAMRVMRKVPVVPETKPVRDLLREFRQNKVHIAFVLDEYGGTAGIVTIEDIMEVLVGDIADEFEPPAPESLRRIDADTVEIDARVHVSDLNRELDVALPEDGDYDTLGGFVFSTLGRVPTAGEEFRHENVHIRILDAEERKINRLRVHVARAPQAAETDGA